MIELTDELVAAYVEAWRNRLFREPQDQDRPAVREGLTAVLALVERDYKLVKLCTEELMPGLRCTRETYGEPHRGDHEGKTSTGNAVKWS